jgi:hypothetical protein
MPEGRGFFPPDTALFPGNSGGLQGKAARYDGKRPPDGVQPSGTQVLKQADEQRET